MSNLVIIYVILSIFTICILLLFLVKCEKKTQSNFCMCGGIANLNKNCRSPAESRKLYAEGNTEYSVFSKNPNYNVRPSWM